MSDSAYPHFGRITASSSTNEFNLTGDTAGEEFVVTLTPLESDLSGSGAQTIEGALIATLGTATTANSGKNDINVAANWTDGVPNASDDVYFDFGDTTRSAMYNLDALAAVTLTSLNFFGSFTGDVGLPKINAAISATEYRPDYLQVGATTINVNIVGGTGSGLIRVNVGSVACSVNVYGTGSSSESEVPAFIWKGTSASNALRVEDGSVGVAFYGGETANLTGGLTVIGGDVFCGAGTTLSGITQGGGTLDTASALGTVTQNDGTHLHRAGTVTALVLNGGTFECHNPAAMTITDLTIGPDGVLDLENAVGLVTITNTAVLRPGATIRDKNNRLATTFTYSCVGGPNSVNVERGQGAATVALS